MNAYRRNGVQALLRIGYRRNSKGGIGSIHHRSVMIALLSLCLAAPGLAAPGQLAAQSHQDSGPVVNQTQSAVPGLHDFDFLVGQWQAHHRKLKQRLANDHEWIEFDGTLLNNRYWRGSAMWTIPCSVFPVLLIAASLCAPSIRRPSSGQSGGSTAGHHPNQIGR